MFDTKLEVDRHVESCLKKLNNENERNLKCMAFARLYFKVGAYEEARRYVSAYLTVKPLSAEALGLLGKSLEKQGRREAALEAYKKSLEIDPKQTNLILKVCELFTSDDVTSDLSGARYFCEKAQTVDPHNPIVFNLKERLVVAESQNPNDVSQLLLTELSSRPNDVHLRVRFLRHLLQNNQVKEAYKYTLEIEQKNLPIFLNSLSWYEIISEVLVRYQRDNIASSNLSWEFWVLLIPVLDKLVALTMDESSNNNKSGSECISVIFNFDQTLEVAVKSVSSCNERSFIQEFITHYRAQLCFHLVILLFKQAKRDLIKYKDAMQMALPLLFASYHTQPADLQSMWLDYCPEIRKQQVQRWHREAAFRCSQAGHILLAAAKDRKVMFMEKATQSCSGLWREQLFKKLFVTRDQQAKLKSSYFVSNQNLLDVTVRLPDNDPLAKYDEIAQLVHPNSLHHLTWICMNRKLPTFKCMVFDGLQYSVKNLNSPAAESLNILDIDAFLYCSTLCVQQALEEMKHQIYYNSDKPQVLPASVTNQLGTLNQSKWLTSAYKMYKNEYGSNMSELRLNLIRGIEVVRCIGNHGLDAKLLVTLARTFAERARSLNKQSEIEFNEVRAELYWKAALPLLEKLLKNQAVTYGSNRLFEYKSKEMSLVEISNFIDEGKLFNATQLMKRREHEKALHMFENLKSPYASFYQAQIYKTMADEQVNQNKENVTSEMRSQHIILLSRSRDCLYLTLDRLRDPSVDRKHPLNTQLGTEIEKMERLLSRIDPDVYNHRNECDGMSDENDSSAGGSIVDQMNTIYSSNVMGGSFYPNESSTPQYDRNMHPNRYRFELPSRREARPSPERLDAQLRQMQAARDANMSHILEQNRLMGIMADSCRNMVDELRSCKEAFSNLTSTMEDVRSIKQIVNEEFVNGLKNVMDELHNFKDVSELVHEIKKEIAELKKDSNKPKTNQLSEEDLYVLDEEYSNDYVLNTNVPSFTAGNLYPNYQPRLPSTNSLNYPPAAALYPGLYPMYPYTNLGLPQAGALQFGQEPQITDFRTINPLSQSNYGQPGITSNKSPWEVGVVPPGLNQLNLMQSLGQPLTIPQPSQAQGVGIFKDTIISTAAPNTSSLNLFPSASIAPTLSIFSSAPSISATITPTAPISNKNTPVVIITSSDPLPKATIQTTQVLSVTIPPQHLKGNLPPKSQPHNYQIPLPASSVPAFTATPTIINQPSPIVSTQGLLSNIAPPVYSAIERSPSKSTGLGLQIEKSLSQGFITSTKNDSFNRSNSSSHSVEEHDPCPDFKPLIPLPDEVPVNTGEENEIALFCERAKLFRFTDKEWRERGVGNIKILKNKDTGKIRILMRRDQVHKICANHFLAKDMQLTPMVNSGRAYVWAAHDFADEEMVLEKLCVKFKTEEDAAAFYSAFTKAKESLPELDTSTTQDSAMTASLGGFKFTTKPTFKPKELIPVPNITDYQETKTSPFASFTFGVKPTTPVTDMFSTPTKEFKPVQIPPSSEQKITSSPKSPGSGDDFEPTVEFAPVIPLPELVDIKTGEENAEILFESRAKLLRFDLVNKEWKERGVGIMKILKENTIRLVMRREQVHKVCCNHQLLTSIQFKKMTNSTKALTWYAQDFSEGIFKAEMFAIRFKSEEQADAFYKAITSAKELLDDNNVVKSDQKVAIPEIKSEETTSNKVKAKEDKKVKSEPKVETVLKPSPRWSDKFKAKLSNWECKNCCTFNDRHSHFCETCDTPKSSTSPRKSSDMEKSGTQFSFGVNLTPTSPPANSQYLLGKPSETTTIVTSTAFLFGQNTATSSSSSSISSSSWGDAFKPKEGTWECQQCFVRNEAQILYCIACNSPKDSSVPKKDVKQGINLDTTGSAKFKFGTSPQITSVSKQETQSHASSWGDKFKPKEGSWECEQCLVRNEPDKMYCVSCENPKDDSVPKKESNKGINLETPGLQFNFGIPGNNTTNKPTPTTAAAAFTFASKSTPTFTFGTAIQSPADSTTGAVAPMVVSSTAKPFVFTLNTEVASDKKKEVNENVDQFVFGSPQKHAFEFIPRSPRRHSSGCQGDEESDNLVEDEGDHIYFKPIIPLPDKVEVKTGEEQEKVLYCHRAKLFRYVQSEWKERGIGDLKILFNVDTGRLRVLMRRELIFKICLNHILTVDIEYIPKDDKTWLFSAPDFSEGEINRWQFCLRFKSAEIAQEFKKAIGDALKRTATGSSSETKASDTTATTEDNDLDDVQIISETKVTPEEEQEAIRLKLPLKFMSYRRLPDCACETCKKDDEVLSELFQQKATTKQQESVTTTSTGIFGTTTSIFGTPCKPFGGNNTMSTSFLFGQPFKSTTDVFGNSKITTPPQSANTTLSKSESLKDMLMKPSVLSNIADANKTPESTTKTKNLFSTTETTPQSNTMKNFTFTFKTDLSTPTTPTGSLFSQTTSSDLFHKVSEGVGGSTTPGNLFAAPTATVISSGSIFGGRNLFPSTTTTTMTTTTSIFSGELKKPLFGGTAPIFSGTANNVPSFGSMATKIEPVDAEPKKNEDDIVLKCDSNLSFASLAAGTSSTKAFAAPTEDKSKPFAFLGSGTPVFASLNKTTPKSGSKKVDKDKTNSGDEGEASDSEEYDPHYEPIVPLPDAIVVCTGEEDEEVKFTERAKLYRYDNQNKEWKERGVGQMKILHHPVNGTYRFLLRREQVHKVVLNMLVTSGIELQQMSTSDKAWLWYGHNYSDDESAWEKLAVRFKTCELAEQFHTAAQQAIEAVKKQQDNKDLPSIIQNYGEEQETSQDTDVIVEGQDGEDDEYDDDDDRTIMFTKQCQLSEQLQNGEWKDVGTGELQVYYDSEIYGSRIAVVDNDGHMLSHTLIGVNTEMTEQDDNSCIWRAVEWTEVQPRWRTLKATFSNQQEAEHLRCSYLESVQFAHESDLLDGIFEENSDTDEN